MTDTIFAPDELSEREIEILRLLNDGLTNHDIADKTGLTLYTVKWYLKQIYSKLHVNNRTQAAARAREIGILNGKSTSNPRITSNLPAVVTPFYGRDDELAHIRQLITNSLIRLITLHASGGMGKTRLAMEIGTRFKTQFADGIYFVSLERTSGDPLATVVNTLQLPIDSTGDVLGGLSAFLKDKHCLIVLDNFEHILSQAFRISALLERTKYITILVTSRAILHIQGEYAFPLEGLTVPRDKTRLENNAAYQLYVQRARASYVNFAPDKTEQSAIADICELLGGMPLAIEIAAGWASVLTARDTLHRLRSSLDLLTSDEQDRPQRQQSIRATFDYSWDLLSPQAQQALLMLGVFDPDGFSFEAAEQIASVSPPIIKQLLDKALIQHKDNQRFVFHPLIRQYVTERLHNNPPLLEHARIRHGEYYFDFVMHHIQAFRKQLDLAVVHSFLHETYNLDKAWTFALETRRLDWLESAVEVGYLCEVVALWQETDLLFEITLDHVPPSYTILRGRLLAFRAIYAYRTYNLETMTRFALQSWDILKDTPYAWDAGSALAYLAVAEALLGNDQRGLEILDQIEPLLDRTDLEDNLYARGAIACARPTYLLYAGRNEEAVALLEQINVPHWHEVNIRLPEAYINLGMIAEARDALERLYNASLDNHYYKSAVYSVFYLAVIDAPPDQLTPHLIQNLTELTRISGHYSVIAHLALYFATLLNTRGHTRWANLLFYSTIHMLSDLGEISLMYQHVLHIAHAIRESKPEIAHQLLSILIHDEDCPVDIQQSATRQLAGNQTTTGTIQPDSFLNTVASLLITP